MVKECNHHKLQQCLAKNSENCFYIVNLCFQYTFSMPSGWCSYLTIRPPLGASSGIGAATAVYLAERGAKLCLAARNLDNLYKVAEQCNKKGLEYEKVSHYINNLYKMAEQCNKKGLEYEKVRHYIITTSTRWPSSVIRRDSNMRK